MQALPVSKHCYRVAPVSTVLFAFTVLLLTVTSFFWNFAFKTATEALTEGDKI